MQSDQVNMSRKWLKSWNYALSPKRSFATSQLSPDEVQQPKSVIGGTVNDVVMGLCASGRQLPRDPLRWRRLRRLILTRDPIPWQPRLDSHAKEIQRRTPCVS